MAGEDWSAVQNHLEVEASNEILGAYNEIKRLTYQKAVIEIRLAELEEVVKNYIGNRGTLTDANGVPIVQYTKHSRSIVDVDALRENSPKIYLKYLKPIWVRPFLVK